VGIVETYLCLLLQLHEGGMLQPKHNQIYKILIIFLGVFLEPDPNLKYLEH
jgi:hypothetical protein